MRRRFVVRDGPFPALPVLFPDIWSIVLLFELIGEGVCSVGFEPAKKHNKR